MAVITVVVLLEPNAAVVSGAGSVRVGEVQDQHSEYSMQSI